MSSKKKKSIDIINSFSDSFGDDFEVLYEDDNSEDNYYDSRIYHDDYCEDDFYDNNYEDDYDAPHRTRSKRKRKKSTPIAAPIRKSAKTASNLIYTMLGNLSLVLILVIAAYMAVNFLKGSAPYGDIEAELKTQNFSHKMIGYFGVTAGLILYELLSALWSMTKERVRDSYGEHFKEDVGRGLFSFFFIYACSYGSFILSSRIPETNDIVLGIQGALSVFGSMHNVLFGLCTAGIISCLLRKYHL